MFELPICLPMTRETIPFLLLLDASFESISWLAFPWFCSLDQVQHLLAKRCWSNWEVLAAALPWAQSTYWHTRNLEPSWPHDFALWTCVNIKKWTNLALRTIPSGTDRGIGDFSVERIDVFITMCFLLLCFSNVYKLFTKHIFTVNRYFVTYSDLGATYHGVG